MKNDKNETLEPIQVGDTMILVEPSGLPSLVKVTRVTPKQSLYVEGGARILRPMGRTPRLTAIRDHIQAQIGWESPQWFPHELYCYTDANFSQLQHQYDRVVDRRNKEEEERKHQQEEREAKHVEEVERTKAACGDLGNFCERVQGLAFYLLPKDPGCARIFTAVLPVKEHVKEKKFTVLIVKIWDFSRPEWDICSDEDDSLNKVRYSYAFTHGDKGSFSSSSVGEAKNDTEALWEAINSAYRSW